MANVEEIKPDPLNVALYPSDEDDEEEILSHKTVMERFEDGVAEMIMGDPLLNDLHTKVTVEEIQSQIALEYGQAMTVNIIRADNEVLPVVVIQTGRVIDLKKAIARHFTLKLAREGKERKISWSYIWKRYWLYYNGEKLTDDNKLLKDYGIRNKEEVSFIKRLRQQ